MKFALVVLGGILIVLLVYGVLGGRLPATAGSSFSAHVVYSGNQFHLDTGEILPVQVVPNIPEGAHGTLYYSVPGYNMVPTRVETYQFQRFDPDR